MQILEKISQKIRDEFISSQKGKILKVLIESVS